jgi:hypothetical protein
VDANFNYICDMDGTMAMGREIVPQVGFGSSRNSRTFGSASATCRCIKSLQQDADPVCRIRETNTSIPVLAFRRGQQKVGDSCRWLDAAAAASCNPFEVTPRFSSNELPHLLGVNYQLEFTSVFRLGTIRCCRLISSP